MGLKIDPKTGMIVKGPLRIAKFPPTRRRARRRTKKTDNMFPAIPVHSVSLQSQEPHPRDYQGGTLLSPDQLMKIATAMGKVIAEEINDRPIQVHMPPESLARASMATAHDPQQPIHSIQIDESIIDVGLGQTAELEKGKDSASLAKDELKSDEALAHSKNRLRALKNK